MVELTEFIVASRANKIIRNSRLTDVSYTGLDRTEYGFYKDTTENYLTKITSPEKAYMIQKRLEDILFFLFPGTTCNRFVGVEDTTDVRYFYPITVADITIDEKKAFVPFFFGNDTLFAISPFLKLENTERIGDKFIAPICKISDLDKELTFSELEELLSAETDNDRSLYGTASIGDRFKVVVQSIVELVSPISEAIKKTFPRYEYSAECEVVSVKEPGYTKMYERLGMETELFVDTELGLLKNPEDIIKEIDFLPIVLKHETNTDGNTVDYITMSLVEKRQADGSQRVIRRVNLRSNNDEMRSSSDLSTQESKHVINDLLVLRETGSIYPLINIDEFAYYYNGSVCFIKDGTILDGFKIEDLYEVSKGYPEVAETAAVTEQGEEYIRAEEGVSDIVNSLKVIGIRTGSTLYGIIAPIFKLPKEIVVDFWNFIRRAFFMKQNNASKEYTDELRVKALNDDLDVYTDKMKRWIEIPILGVASCFIAGGVVFGCTLWYIMNKVAKKYRAKAMEPLEHQINISIQVVDMKIRFAESEGDTKKIEELMRYRGHLILMKHKTENYKKELTDKDQLEYNKVQEVERTGGGY